MHRFDSPKHGTQRPFYGLAIYVKESLTVKYINKKREHNVQFFSLDIEIRSGLPILFLFLYIPPKTNLLTLKNMLGGMLRDCLDDQTPVVLTGDFNIDNLSSQTGNIIKFLSEFNFKYLPIYSTTDYGSALDHLNTNISETQIQTLGTLEAYFSDHKPLYIALK